MSAVMIELTAPPSPPVADDAVVLVDDAEQDPQPWKRDMAEAARSWAQTRLATTG